MNFVGNIHDRAPPPPPAYRPRPSAASKTSSSSTSSAYANASSAAPFTTPTSSQPTPSTSINTITNQGQNRNSNDVLDEKIKPLAESTPLHPTNTKPGIKDTTLEKTELSTNETVLIPDKSSTTNTERPISRETENKRINYSEMVNASTSEKFWYKPKMSRDRAIQLLKNAAPGDFIVRDSKSYQGSYGLCVRVEKHQVPRSVLDSLPPKSDESCQLVRHFLIEGSQKGVKVAGSDREPNFASLAALIHQHCHTPLSLPIKLNIPLYDITTTDPKSTNKQNNHSNIDQISTTLYYLDETDTEMLTGEAAIERCYEVYKSNSSSTSSGCSIHVKASSEGLLLTDSKLTKFFRKHYSSDSISYCGYYNGQSGMTEQWANQNASPEKIIGIVAKKSASNTCVLLKTDQTETSDKLIKYLSMIIQKNSLMDGTQNGIY